MPFEKGNKYGGARKVKPFRDALMMEIKAAGDDHKTLRKIAPKRLTVMCQQSTRLLIGLTAKLRRR
jgi:hypothetical protein